MEYSVTIRVLKHISRFQQMQRDFEHGYVNHLCFQEYVVR